MAKRVTTLFIRDTAINLLVMKGGQVEKWGSSPLEPGLVSEGLIIDEDQVADQVKELFKQEKAKMNKVIIGLSGLDSLYRVVTLPELPEEILPEAIRREAQRAIPTPLEEVYFSYQILSAPKGERRVFLATFPRNLVDALIRTLRKAGVKPYIMDLAPLALCRIPDEPRAIVVNARLTHLDITVITDRTPQLIRTLSLPSEAKSLEDKLPFIAEEFNRTVAFYNSTHMERQLDSSVPVFVCGDPAEVPETWPSLISEGYSASLLPPPVEPPEGFNTNEFMVNIGLALKELLPEKEEANFSLVNFNALPEVYLPEHFSIVRVLIPVGIAVGIGLVVIMGILVLQNRANIERLTSQVTVAESRVVQQQGEVTQLRAQVQSIKGTADELHNRLVNLQRARAVMLDDLREIHGLAAGKVSLGTISYGGSSVTVTGSAPDVDAIFRYARDLRSSKDATGNLRFSRVWIPSITNAGKAFSFALTK
jgi:type IV pilus assembly protein PilM